MVAGAVRHLLPGEGRRAYTDDERAVVEDVLDAAAEWAAGRLPLGEFWRVGTLLPRRWSTEAVRDREGRTTAPGVVCHGRDMGGYSRFVALNWAVKHGDPRRHALRAAIEAAGREVR